MILDIDAGNTFVKWRVMGGANIVARGSEPTATVMTGKLSLGPFATLSKARLSSVANKAVAQSLQKQLHDEFNVELEIARVSPSVAGVSCGYEQPDTLGIDRWLAVIAAYHHYAGAVLVVDAGSAITIDLVGPQGEHLGGYILPGLVLMRAALWQGTDKVQVESEESINMLVPGTSTENAVNRGCLLAAVATIEKLASQYPASVVMTGGDAVVLADALSLQSEHRADLVLEGLAIEGVEFAQSLIQ